MADGAGDVVGGHEKGPQHQSPAQQVIQHPLYRVVPPGEQEGQQGHRANESDGDIPGDDLPPQEEQPTQNQQQGADLPQGAPDEAHEHFGQIIHLLKARQVPLVEQGHRGGVSGRVKGPPGGHIGPGTHPSGHLSRPGKHKGPGREGGVEKVLTHAAEELLDNYNGKKITDEENPVGNGHRADKSDEHAGDSGAEVPQGIAFLQQSPVQPFEATAARQADGRN